MTTNDEPAAGRKTGKASTRSSRDAQRTRTHFVRRQRCGGINTKIELTDLGIGSDIVLMSKLK